jgi:hypothetical protein
MTKKKATKLRTATQALEIREPHPGEEFFFTGNAEHRRCLVIEEVFGHAFVTGCQYYPVAESAPLDIAALTESVLFHDAASQSGERFSITQHLDDRHSDSCVHAELFRQPLRRWLMRGTCDECDNRMWDVGTTVGENSFPRLDYVQQLDNALLPLTIESTDHPIVARLMSIFDDLEDLNNLDDLDDCDISNVEMEACV